jgi:hypothetical protein
VGEGQPQRDRRALLTDVPLPRRGAPRGGEAFASGPFELDRFDQRLWPGATVEVDAEGIGVLRVRLGRPDARGPGTEPGP